MTRSVLVAFAVASSTMMMGARSNSELESGIRGRISAANESERYAEFPPILLPESAAPVLPVDRTQPGQSVELVFAFVVDTLGRVEIESVETLATTDSTLARAARSNLSGIRYVPARLVLDVGRCVAFNGNRGHCGGMSPVVKKLRARVVLRINSSIPPS